MEEGLLIILSGPSGVGKGTVCRSLLGLMPDLKLSVSATTRPPRWGEKSGRDYIFLNQDSFKNLIKEDSFLEWACVHRHYYGTLKETVNSSLSGGADLLLEIDIQGAIQVKEKRPGAVSVFLAPPSWKELEKRIAGRGTEDELTIRRRLMTAREEMAVYHTYDYVVVNRQVEKAAANLQAIVMAEKSRVARGARPPGWGGEDE